MAQEKAIQLTYAKVENLYGSLTHEIPLSSEGVTFIHGPNGSGKTSTLVLIEAALTRNLAVLRSTWFGKLSLVFSNGEAFCVERISAEVESVNISRTPVERQEVSSLDFVKMRFDKESLTFIEEARKSVQPNLYQIFLRTRSPRANERDVQVARYVEQFLPFLERLGPRQWAHKQSGQLLSFTDVLEMYGDSLPFLLPPWINSICDAVHLGNIKAQRLLNISTQSVTSAATFNTAEAQQKVQDAVDVNALLLATRIERTIAEAAWSSQARERSFPRRIILSKNKEKKSEDELRTQYRELEEKIQGLVETGLYTDTVEIPLPTIKLTPTDKKIVALYLTDMSEKLERFDDLQAKLLAFREIVGSKLRRKKLVVDRQKGYYFKTTEGKIVELPPSALSSGEQHQIVMFFSLIFASTRSSFFLIDEPEISLHVEWQRQFLSDIQRVSKLMGHTFLVATHSPQIINSRFDLAVGLDGGVSP